MSKDLRFPLDIQLFGDDGGEGGSTDTTGSASIGAEKGAGSSIDYNKIADIVSKRSNVASESALKGYLKEQGLSGEDLNSAVTQFKESQAQQAKQERDRLGNLESENASLKAQIQNTKLDTHITSKVAELGVQAEKTEFILRLINREGLLKEDGTINEEKSASALDEVLKAFPDFKTENNSTGFKKIGGNKEEGQKTEDEEMKKWRKEAGLD